MKTFSLTIAHWGSDRSKDAIINVQASSIDAVRAAMRDQCNPAYMECLIEEPDAEPDFYLPEDLMHFQNEVRCPFPEVWNLVSASRRVLTQQTPDRLDRLNQTLVPCRDYV